MLVVLPLFVLFSITLLEAGQGSIITFQSSKLLFEQSRRPKQSEKEQRERRITQAVLGNFAHIVANILNIMQDPENRENVTIQSSLMVGNIINMVVQATAKNRSVMKEEISQLFDDTFKDKLVAIIRKQIKQSYNYTSHRLKNYCYTF